MSEIPSGAVRLFNGKDVSNWVKRDGSPAGWPVENGVMSTKGGDIVSLEKHTDFLLHVEFMTPDMPDATGQHKGNSGVFVQGRYEVQVLDSYGIPVPGKGDCAAVYNMFAPLVNACLPPLQWQTYDVVFRSARVDENGAVVECARMTLLYNGIPVQNNILMETTTAGAVDENVGEPGPLLLQDHGNDVKFRNVWLLPLPLNGSDKY